MWSLSKAAPGTYKARMFGHERKVEAQTMRDAIQIRD